MALFCLLFSLSNLIFFLSVPLLRCVVSLCCLCWTLWHRTDLLPPFPSLAVPRFVSGSQRGAKRMVMVTSTRVRRVQRKVEPVERTTWERRQLSDRQAGTLLYPPKEFCSILVPPSPSPRALSKHYNNHTTTTKRHF